MRLILRCTGGFAGPAGTQTRTVDLAQLPADRAGQLQQLIHAIDFAALPPKLVKDAPRSWDFQYDLELEDGGQRTHCVQYHLDAAPAPLKALTEKLNDEVDPD
ncbi:protealysin inhibitor emfourin [Duganella callida]|uniref:Uncharacterized protein n=1 Tax=Duganella callida TaxID=2561932 RepID=A0A4Y9SL77_9BURK|nr:protealysin inhibitor emfourin [Duganella callida]TFW24310.1 hypothetical protein E4L98_10475 [Duganella callida]